jgi:hypothetical protein
LEAKAAHADVGRATLWKFGETKAYCQATAVFERAMLRLGGRMAAPDALIQMRLAAARRRGKQRHFLENFQAPPRRSSFPVKAPKGRAAPRRIE